MSERRKVILVTDGDKVARRTVEVAAKNINARCISASAGNPTPRSGKELVELVKKAPHDPVVVMFDDRGWQGKGEGEQALEYVAQHPDIEVLGVVAVASNTPYVEGIDVAKSIAYTGDLVDGPVDKDGVCEQEGHHILEGDTVDVLSALEVPIIGMGDIGKMSGADSFQKGAPLTTKALQEILIRSGFAHGKS